MIAARLVAALCALVTLPAAADGATDRQSRLVSLPPERTLSIEITVGALDIKGEARADASIEIVRHAPAREGLERMPIDIDESASHVRVSAVQRDGGTDPKYRTEVRLRVPREARLTLVRAMEGPITIAGLHGAIDATSQRGSITATDISGVVRLETGIGDVAAVRAQLSEEGLLRLRAFNGNVRLALVERPANARVMALALNGTVQSDIPLTMKESWGPIWGEATLGEGHPVISIDVVTGQIEITTS